MAFKVIAWHFDDMFVTLQLDFIADYAFSIVSLYIELQCYRFGLENSQIATTGDFHASHSTRMQRAMAKLNSVTVFKILILVLRFNSATFSSQHEVPFTLLPYRSGKII